MTEYYIVQDEGNEPILANVRGKLVSVVDRIGQQVTAECGDGFTHFLFIDELIPTPCADNPTPDIGFGDYLLALTSFRDVHVGHHYYVDDIAPNGLVRLATFDPVTNEHPQLKGWYDPRCFRIDKPAVVRHD